MRGYKGYFYDNAPWRKIRNAVWSERKGLCEDCLKRGIYRAADVVHHIVPITQDNLSDPNITLNKDNLRLLCHECHAEEHKAKNGKRYSFDDEGNVV